MSNEVATGLLLALVAFWRELFKLLTLPFTRRERAVAATVEEAAELRSTMITFAQMGKDFGQVVKDFNVERDMYRAREKERDEQHGLQVRALEKSLIEAQEQIKDLNERIENQQEIQDRLKADYAVQERLVDEQGRRIQALETSEKQAHRLVIEKDLKITELEKRVKELEAEIAHLKAQQQKPAPIEVIVASIGATNEPLADGQSASTQPLPSESAASVPGSAEVREGQ